MNILELPWLEIAIATTLLGALCVGWLRDPYTAYGWGLGFNALVFVFSFLAWLSFYLQIPPRWSVQPALFNEELLGMDELNAPLVPVVSLLHFLTALATTRTKMRRFSSTWSLASEGLRLAIFSCSNPTVLTGLLIAGIVPAYIELVNRGRSTRVFVLHMALFVGLLLIGQILVETGTPGSTQTALGAGLLMVAVLVRCGTVPAHCWVTDWFEHSSFGIALLYVTPLVGMYAAVRLVLPIAPDWVLHSIGLISMFTAVYAAGMAIVQRDARRFFAYLFVSHASLVLLGLELHTRMSLTGSLCLWFSVILSLGGFGLTLRALEARYGRLSLTDYRGLYEHSPALAVCFLLTGLASVGFPGTLGFVSAEVLVDGAIVANVYVGLAVIAASALNGIAVVRAYFLLFTGTRHVSTVSLGIGLRERIAVLTLTALILGGGLFPQPGVTSRDRAAMSLLRERKVGDDSFDFENEFPESADAVAPAHHSAK